MLKFLLSIISGLVFALTYFLSPAEVRSEYSAIALTIALTIEILLKQFFLGGISNRGWGVYLIIYAFTIPSIIFNDLIYIQIKFYAFKVLFLGVVVFGYVSRKFNIMEMVFAKLINKLFGAVSDSGWRVINLGFIIYLSFATFGAMLAQFFFSEAGWVFFKGIVLGIVALVYVFFVLGYAYLDAKKQKLKAEPKS